MFFKTLFECDRTDRVVFSQQVRKAAPDIIVVSLYEKNQRRDIQG